jgi:hypothetical protein
MKKFFLIAAIVLLAVVIPTMAGDKNSDRLLKLIEKEKGGLKLKSDALDNPR